MVKMALDTKCQGTQQSVPVPHDKYTTHDNVCAVLGHVVGSFIKYSAGSCLPSYSLLESFSPRCSCNDSDSAFNTVYIVEGTKKEFSENVRRGIMWGPR